MRLAKPVFSTLVLFSMFGCGQMAENTPGALILPNVTEADKADWSLHRYTIPKNSYELVFEFQSPTCDLYLAWFPAFEDQRFLKHVKASKDPVTLGTVEVSGPGKDAKSFALVMTPEEAIGRLQQIEKAKERSGDGPGYLSDVEFFDIAGLPRYGDGGWYKVRFKKKQVKGFDEVMFYLISSYKRSQESLGLMGKVCNVWQDCIHEQVSYPCGPDGLCTIGCDTLGEGSFGDGLCQFDDYSGPGQLVCSSGPPGASIRRQTFSRVCRMATEDPATCPGDTRHFEGYCIANRKVKIEYMKLTIRGADSEGKPWDDEGDVPKVYIEMEANGTKTTSPAELDWHKGEPDRLEYEFVMNKLGDNPAYSLEDLAQAKIKVYDQESTGDDTLIDTFETSLQPDSQGGGFVHYLKEIDRSQVEGAGTIQLSIEFVGE